MKKIKRPDFWHEGDTLAYRKNEDIVVHHRGQISGCDLAPFLPECVAMNGYRQEWRTAKTKGKRK